MGSNKLTAIDETEYLSPSQSPETSFLQLSPTKLTITKTYSNKGRFMSIAEHRQRGLGLGADQRLKYNAEPGDSYKDVVRKVARARFSMMES
ncbi:unnamed protein product [Rotaria magnacalcarata]